jgi:nucleotide-binding universal stress UspA family protein
MSIKKILIPTDFSKASDLLLNCVPELRALNAEEIILAHVVDAGTAGGSATLFMENNVEKLENIRTGLGHTGLKVEIEVRVGFPSAEILNIARENSVSLILVGSHGAGFIKRFFIGSTAFDLIRISDIPVLVEKYREEKGEMVNACTNKFSKVVIASDFSPCSLKAIDFIASQKESIDEVILAAVIERGNNEMEVRDLARQKNAELEDISKKFEGVKASAVIEVGEASQKILEIAQQEEATLIAFAKRGQGRIKEVLLGSTAQEIVRNSKIATLIIPC